MLLVDLDEDALEAACGRIGSNRVSLVGNVTRAEGDQAMIDTAIGGVDIFLANAGVEGDVASLMDYPEERFDELMAINARDRF